MTRISDAAGGGPLEQVPDAVQQAARVEPEPGRSWTLTNGPWIFVESDPGSCRPGPWTRLDLHENLVTDGAPAWTCDGGVIAQAEGGDQYVAAMEYLERDPTPNRAVVTTLGIDPATSLRVGVTSAFVECYLQAGVTSLRNLWQAGHDGWPDPIAVVGVYDGVTLAEYVEPVDKVGDVGIGWPGLRALGRRFGVYASDAMSDADWATLAAL